ncbi:MAG TPA: SRPBCC family protein [Chthoniobacterales bacterium]|jgi:hypothetical protein
MKDQCASARWSIVFLALLLTTQLSAGGKKPSGTRIADASSTAWVEVANTDGVDIYSRTRAGSPLKEFRSVGEIDAPSNAVFAILNDPQAYPSFMPYCAECRVLQRTKSGAVIYHRLDLPWVSDRDYTLRSTHSKVPGPNGPIYLIRWQPANDLGPAPKPGVERVEVCEGSWLLDPTSTRTTRATYLIYSGTGGAIPAFIANRERQIAIRKVFDALRAEVRKPKYAHAKR